MSSNTYIDKRRKEKKEEYYKKAVVVWKKMIAGADFNIPSLKQVNGPRSYKDEQGIVTFDSLEEFIDNNHPEWQELRDLYLRVMRGQKEDKDFAKFIHNKWGRTNKIDLIRNLTIFPSASSDEDNAAWEENNVKTTISEKVTLEEMMIDNVKRDKSSHENSELLNGKSSDCGYCKTICLCSPGHENVVSYKMGKRKMVEKVGASKHKKEDDMEQDGGDIKYKKEDYIDTVAAAAIRQSAVEKSAGIFNSVTEVFNFNQMYNTGKHVQEEWLSEEQAQELNSLEDIYNAQRNLYSSPYSN